MGLQSDSVVDLFDSKANKKAQAARAFQVARDWVETHHDSVDNLVTAIKQEGTPVIVLEGLSGAGFQLVLKTHGFDVGFIAPPARDEDASSFHALKALMAQFGYSFEAHQHLNHGVFILTPRLLNIHYMAHQLHHWVAYQQGLPGYSLSERKAYKVFKTKYKGIWGTQLENENPELLKALRYPLRREIETLEFVKHVTDEIFGPLHEARNHLNEGTALA